MKAQCTFNQAVKFGIITDVIAQDEARGNSMTNKGTNMKPKRIRSQPLINNFYKKKNWVQSFSNYFAKQMHIQSQQAI